MGLRGAWLSAPDVVVLSVAVGEPAPVPLAGLTPAEAEVVRLALAGLSRAAIARRRSVATATVRRQLEAAYRKLDVGSLAELAALVAARRTQPDGTAGDSPPSPIVRLRPHRSRR